MAIFIKNKLRNILTRVLKLLFGFLNNILNILRVKSNKGVYYIGFFL